MSTEAPSGQRDFWRLSLILCAVLAVVAVGLGGLAIFVIGSILAGAALSFWWLVAARAVQGLGMGILMPLSQTIVGDIIPPR